MLTEQERKTIEQRLLRERESVLESLDQFEERTGDLRDEAGELSVYRLHPADLGTEAYEQEQSFLLQSKEGRRLYEIDEALQRLYKEPDRFGICDKCGRDIGFARLEVIPEANLCADDARQADAASGAAANPREAGPSAAV